MITRLPPVDQRIYSLPVEKQVRELGDYLMRYRRESEFLLNGNLDEKNVIRAGSVYAENIITTNAKIKAAQIETLTVGGNVIMGPNATISWSKVTSQPYIPTSADITTITANYVATPNLITNIARVNKSLELGQQSDNSAKTLTFHAGVSSRNSQLISTITDGYSDLEIKSASITLNNFDGAYIYNLKATSSSFFGTVNFSGANVLGLNYIKPYSQANWCYVDATSSGVAFRDSSGSLLGVIPYA